MWNATYKDIDKSGLSAELLVTVEYTDGTTVYDQVYSVLPDDLKGSFTTIVQNQIDILNAKENIQKTDLTALVDTEIKLDPSPVIKVKSLD